MPSVVTGNIASSVLKAIANMFTSLQQVYVASKLHVYESDHIKIIVEKIW